MAKATPTARRGQTRGSDPIRRAIRILVLAMPLALACTSASVAGPPSREAFVTNQEGNSLSVVDVATMKVVSDIKLGGNPAGIALSGDRKLAYVTAPESKEVFVIDTRSARSSAAFRSAGAHSASPRIRQSPSYM